MRNPRRVRRLVLQGLCCLDVRGEGVWTLLDRFISDSREPAETIEAARTLLREVFDDCEACDTLLSPHAHHWNLSRLALVDRNILRLAVHEIRSGKAPYKVAITEAIKLAEEFSTAESSRFINGVLDSVARELLKTSEQG